MQLAGKVAVITGGASGIGRGTALAMARRGTDLVIADINDDRLEETRSAIARLGTPQDFTAFLADEVSKWTAIVKLAGARMD